MVIGEILLELALISGENSEMFRHEVRIFLKEALHFHLPLLVFHPQNSMFSGLKLQFLPCVWKV
jgi:hypothetical protein